MEKSLYSNLNNNHMEKSRRTNVFYPYKKSFRLERLPRGTLTKKHSQTFYKEQQQNIKLAPLHSVNRSVKYSLSLSRYNDLSYLIGRNDLGKLRRDPQSIEDSHYQSAHSNLSEIRRKYDQVKKERADREQNIRRLKEQAKKYDKVKNQYIQRKESGWKELQNIQIKLEQKKREFQQSIMQKKVLINMRNRIKYDKIVYDQRKFDMEKQEKYLIQQLSVLKRDGMGVDEENDRATRVYKKMIQELEEERKQRETHLNNLENMIQEKISSFQESSLRENEKKQIAQRAMQDRLFSEKQWQKILYTNMLLNQLLRQKIDKQMEKFAVVQFAYKTIKTATGVGSANNFVDKYLNKEKAYGDLLSRITINQQKIASLRQETSILQEEEKELEDDYAILQVAKQTSVDVTNQQKSLNKIKEKKKGAQTLLNKMAHFLNKQTRKLCLFENYNEIFVGKSYKQITEGMKRYFHMLMEILVKCSQTEIQDKRREEDLSTKNSARVTRISPQKSQNSKGQEIYQFQQEQSIISAESEEKRLIDNERERMLKVNERFMRTLKKKKDRQRRIMLEKQASKKYPDQH